MLRTGERVDRDALCERLIRGGYRAVSQVIEHADYARPDCQRIALKNYRR
jgi:transcription-repair coupling factor (superfamily II helicase)